MMEKELSQIKHDYITIQENTLYKDWLRCLEVYSRIVKNILKVYLIYFKITVDITNFVTIRNLYGACKLFNTSFIQIQECCEFFTTYDYFVRQIGITSSEELVNQAIIYLDKIREFPPIKRIFAELESKN